MPLINIKTWPTPKPVKKKLMEEITRIYHQEAKVPLDKIVIIFEEINPEAWCEGGTLGSDPEFKSKSRRLEYSPEEKIGVCCE